MCGITGIYYFSEPRPVDRQLAGAMTRALTHRGPDDEGAYFEDESGLFLGHRRLSIIDLEAGQQPMCNENGDVWIVFNGEIYNFPELRRELENLGHQFITRSDTEVIIHAYLQWGVNALEKLNGMFGLAIWDDRRKTLLLARDPFGIKPLYYWNNGRYLVFGSEIKAMLHHPAVKREVDPAALSEFLAITYLPSPQTVFRNIRKLRPGHALLFTEKEEKEFRFYRQEPKRMEPRPEPELVEELQQRIYAAVRRQMISDVPLGVMLSGGVDSSTLASIMTKISGEPVNTFTVGFKGDYKFNELKFAREMAAQLGSKHHEEVVSAQDYSDLLPHSLWHLEEPVATASTLAFYMISRLAAQHVKVVLTGQGVDEPFAGYPRHLGEFYSHYYRKLPARLREKLIAPLVEALPRQERWKRAVRSLQVQSPVERMVNVYQTIEGSLKNDLMKAEFAGNNSEILREAVAYWQQDALALDDFSQMLYVDSRLSLPDNLLMYGDKMSMAVSLEARVPFLDIELMEWVEALPAEMKIRRLTQKYLLKKAVAKWIPQTVIRRKKIGFATPVDQWFRQELNHSVQEQLLDTSSGCSEFLNRGTIETMLEDHRCKKQDYKRVLFSLLTFETWYQQFIKPATWPPAG